MISQFMQSDLLDDNSKWSKDTATVRQQSPVSIPPYTVTEILQHFNNEWLVADPPAGHASCKNFILDQMEELEKKLGKWEPPVNIMESFEELGPKKVRKWEPEDD
jgi:hypothetical protein